MPVAPPDVRDWIERQPEPERAALARTWDAAALARDEAPALEADLEAAWSRLEAALEDEAPPSALRSARPPARAPIALFRGAQAVPPNQGDSLAAQRRTSRQSQPSRGRTGGSDRPASNRQVGAARPGRRWLAGALVAATALVAVVALRPVTVEAEGAVLEVALPDGSTATLAPGSEVSYRRGMWGGTRRVEVEGQVALEVAADGRPFVAETFNAEVEVLGTVFDVLAWPGTETAVALVEGSVRLRSAGGEVVLEPGRVSRVVGEGAPTPPVPVDLEAVTAWQRGGFAVVDAPLEVVAAAVAARFGPTIGLGAGVDAGQRLTLFLPTAETADAVLADVAAYLDLRLQAGPGRYDLLAR